MLVGLIKIVLLILSVFEFYDTIVVALPGFEPGALGYEPSKLPLLYSAVSFNCYI